MIGEQLVKNYLENNGWVVEKVKYINETHIIIVYFYGYFKNYGLTPDWEKVEIGYLELMTHLFDLITVK